VAQVAGIDFAQIRGRPRQAFRAVRFAGHVLMTGGRIIFATRDPRTRFRGRLGAAKGAAWTGDLDLDRVKAVAAALAATVNDVLLAVTAGALRRHLLSHGDLPGDLRVFVPVNLRPADEPVPRNLGNRFGLVFIRLPVGEADARTRVHLVHERMRAVKRSPQAVATFAILSIIGALPSWGHALAVRILGAKSTAVVTNVPGPRKRVFLAGTELDGMVFWVPQAGAVGLGVSILSYADVVCVGIAADRNLVPDPGLLAHSVELELAELAAATGC
jgi:WS/DGAT/MGAT family acyltransferase